MNATAGTGHLARLVLRRDRVVVPVWTAVLVLTAASSAAASIDLYPTARSRVEAASSVNRSGALVALYGRVYDPTSLGAISIIKLGGMGAVCVALLSIVLVVRHTRADEEAGRTELVGATGVGRLAPLGAALVLALVANLSIGVLTGLGLAAAGLPLDGSLAFGAAWFGVGMAFAAVAALAAQLTTGGRAAIGLSSMVLAAVYGVRAVGDAAPEAGLRWLSWLSPVGWAQQFRPYAGNRWWVLLVTLAFTVAVSAMAVRLAARRDLGTGVLPIRPGPPTGRPSLRSPLSLAWRLDRASVLGWSVAFVLLGALVGSIATGVEGFLTSTQAQDFITRLGGRQGLSDSFLAVELVFSGIFASAFGIQAVLRLRAEEQGGRAEPVLATGVGRTRWAGAQVAVALVGTTFLLLLAGVTAGVSYAVASGDAAQFGRVLAAALVQVPAAWVLVGITLALYGVSPRLAVGGWVALAGFVLLGELGPLFELDHWAMDLSPFTHTPRLPGGPVSAPPVVALCLVAAAGVAFGLAAFRRRDLA